jgi:hypothetical protein
VLVEDRPKFLHVPVSLYRYGSMVEPYSVGVCLRGLQGALECNRGLGRGRDKCRLFLECNFYVGSRRFRAWRAGVDDGTELQATQCGSSSHGTDGQARLSELVSRRDPPTKISKWGSPANRIPGEALRNAIR